MKDKRKKRLFIAIDLPASLKNYLSSITTGLNKNDREIRPVPGNNIHLTLRFLGDTLPDRIEKISTALKLTAAARSRFIFSIGQQLEAFPSLHSAKVIYIPVKKGADMFTGIFELLEDNLSKVKVRKESRKFVSHITIARIRNKKDISLLIKALKPELIQEYECSKITLFESRLNPSGAEYIIIDEYELK